jgi:hypothetical protein
MRQKSMLVVFCAVGKLGLDIILSLEQRQGEFLNRGWKE